MSTSTPSSDPAASRRGGPSWIPGSLIVLLAGALVMVGVARVGPASRDLPRLPGSLPASGELAAFAVPNPPTSLDPGVSAPATEAPAYRLENSPADRIVSALTVALGLTAGSQSRSDDQGFVVVDSGSDRVLTVRRAPGHPWVLQRGDVDCVDQPDAAVSSDGTISCPQPGAGGSAGGQSGSFSGTESVEPSPGTATQSDEQVRCPPVDCPEGQACAQVCPEPSPVTPLPDQSTEPADLPDPQDAETRSREVLSALGLDVARTTLAASPDGQGWQTIAEISVGGISAVGLDTRLVIGEDSVVTSGSGVIPDVELLGTYPLIGAPAVLDRLRRQVTGQLGGPEPAVAPVDPEQSTGPSSVIAMRLVLLLQSGGAGEAAPGYLVPAFQLDTSDGAMFHVPAVTDEHLEASGGDPARQ
jgi:hypothetical protein